LLLVTGAVVSAVLAVWAKSAERTAQERKDEADEAKEQAERRRDELAAANDALRRAGYVADVNLAPSPGTRITLGLCRELLDRYRRAGPAGVRVVLPGPPGPR
jgi:hypothetical protein